MKNLILTLGAPASGKSTFIKENGLENYSIATDDIRGILKDTEECILNDKLTRTVKPANDGEAWKILYSLVDKRMRLGETVILDATYLFGGAFSEPLELAHKYHYKVYVIDFIRLIIYNRICKEIKK